MNKEALSRNSVVVARQLLGAELLWRHHEQPNAEPVVFRIVETEAYRQDDPACHAYQRKPGKPLTPRMANLYQAPGRSYVYFTYGMHHCFNIITEPEGIGAAVLIRALEPVDPAHRLIYPTHGPARLCKALSITTATHNQLDLLNPESVLVLREGMPTPDADVICTTRIGISKAKEYPWRFYVKSSSCVSVRDKAAEAAAAGSL